MKRLFTIDLKDYDENFRHFCRPSARGIIMCGDDRLALVYSTRDKYYKFPGGGIHKDEERTDALIREVSEEVGLSVIPESIREFGSVLRLQKGKEPDVIFEQENFYYFCDVRRKTCDRNDSFTHSNATNSSTTPASSDFAMPSLEIGNQLLDGYEAEAGFILRIVPIDEAIATNESFRSDNLFDQVMIDREARVLRMISEAPEWGMMR